MDNDYFLNEDFKIAWHDWINYRFQRRLPKYVPMGLKKTISRLVTITENDVLKAIDYINYSIAQNYQGIFPNPNYEKRITHNNKQYSGSSNDRINAIKNF
jgi:hypothetical protein